jgi:hypothetical protein
MSDASQSSTVHDHVEAALEASCDALIALQLVRVLVAEDPVDLQAVHVQASEAVDCLRQAVDELRLTLTRDPSSVSLGFVLRAPSRAGAAREDVSVEAATNGVDRGLHTAR